MGVARKGHSLRALALGLGSVPSFFPWRQGKRAGAAGGPEVHNVLLKKVRLSLASSIPLGLMRVSAHGSLSQVFPQPGPAQLPLLLSLPSSPMMTSKQ